jgi:hypothetical protein
MSELGLGFCPPVQPFVILRSRSPVSGGFAIAPRALLGTGAKIFRGLGYEILMISMDLCKTAMYIEKSEEKRTWG